eukprot:TRINITY_DN2255_c0_g1_i9.p1 TRINITY_DN2255_c0_g1~~TRINITY_DN2255_c0_g1_i9.p1  ORF type:complete len:137 (+),score=33.85 TRINITY_DN2255_c0_g1_i9:368-778(+)
MYQHQPTLPLIHSPLSFCHVYVLQGNKNSLENVKSWLKEVVAETDEGSFNMFLVGTKSDMFHAVEFEEGESFADEIGAEYWEVSSKTNDGVVELFDRVAAVSFESALFKSHKVEDNDQETFGALKTGEVEEKSCCS